MANIRVDVEVPVYTGQAITFKSPGNCASVDGLVVYYSNGAESRTFQFADAHGNNVCGKNLFAENVLVKVILDTELNRAYVQNADTNAYLESKLAEKYSPDNKPTADDIGAAGKSTVVTASLAAASWTGTAAPYSYTLSVKGVTLTSNQELLPAVGITAEQLAALQAANIQDGGQTAGSITLKAYGDVPTIDIPIRVIKRGD